MLHSAPTSVPDDGPKCAQYSHVGSACTACTIVARYVCIACTRGGESHLTPKCPLAFPTPPPTHMLSVP